MKKVRRIWEKLTIRNKIRMFTTSVFVAIAAALLFDVWIVRLFVMDFNDIMEANSKCGEIVAALNRETDAFDEYVRSTGSVFWHIGTARRAVPRDFAQTAKPKTAV